MIRLKSKEEILKIEFSAKIVAEVLELIGRFITDGVSAYDLERIATEHILKRNAIPAFKGYNNYPYSLCVSVNNEIIHGFPTSEKVLKRGDLVSVDCGVLKDGYFGDAARTFVVDDFETEEGKKLVEVTEKSLDLGIEQAKPGNRIGDIGHAIQAFVESAGFSVIRDYVGHGVGKRLHEDPQIPNYGVKGTGIVIQPGMTLAIEPMISQGHFETAVLPDGWTVVTKDGTKAAHFEHTIVIEAEGSRILSRL
ncbi:methionine aminopeptidase [Kosmotoga arenicorallina S304]|uniref:Methionine aminopeptidase n=1 Tax=Kosmotoga arenicorallina S304 TaxID=1453497 RepID=A0A176K1J3_9BACT|nr:type I methionyl aminopeptidase [Kosmotoga arenicorallina]OAA30844.1 methionine aminopeptidase [Kosmotoga arenicorallina S304]